MILGLKTSRNNSQCELNLRGGGTSGSITIIDSSKNNLSHSNAEASHAQYSSAHTKFKSTAIYHSYQGTSGSKSIYYTDNVRWYLKYNIPFTIETWFFATSWESGAGYCVICGQYYSPKSHWFSPYYAGSAQYNNTTTVSTNEIRARDSANPTFQLNQWNHIRYCNDGFNNYFFANGNLMTLTTNTHTGDGDVAGNMFMFYGGTGNNNYPVMWLDDFRIIKGKCLSKRSFITPNRLA